MLFRHSASLVDAIQFDGSPDALAAILAIPQARAEARADAVELATASGRRLARCGSWVTRDRATATVKLYDDPAFQACHEAVG